MHFQQGACVSWPPQIVYVGPPQIVMLAPQIVYVGPPQIVYVAALALQKPH